MFKLGSPNRSHHRTHFFKYLDAKGARAVLKKITLRYSSPLRFNDPLEIPEELKFPFTEQELHDAVYEEFMHRLENPDAPQGRPGGPADFLLRPVRIGGEEIRKYLIEKMRDHRHLFHGDGLSGFQKEWKSQVPMLRILCLSEVNDDMAMWNHYADSYRGIVVKLDCIDEVDSALLLARRIKYGDGPPGLIGKDNWVKIVLDYGQDMVTELVLEAQHYKTLDWAHEKEWRVVGYARDGELGDYADYAIHEREISEIYLGPKISRSDEDEILRLLRGDLGHVIAHRGKFDTVTNRITFEPLA